jgi:hypothetical protein
MTCRKNPNPINYNKSHTLLVRIEYWIREMYSHRDLLELTTHYMLPNLICMAVEAKGDSRSRLG